jgi:hypothetical protein
VTVVARGYRSQDVFGWLEEVRDRRGMWVGSGGVRELEMLVHGYETARSLHHIDEGVPSMLHFPDWLRLRDRWSLSCGWAAAIEEHAGDRDPLDVFFGLVDEYRSLRPTVVCHAVLAADHVATGKRVRIGFDGVLPAPLRIDVVQYQPLPLHFLRFHPTSKKIVETCARRSSTFARRLLAPPAVTGSRACIVVLDDA